MVLKSGTITKGFIAAGVFNMSVLFFSRLFTNSILTAADPGVMSNFGLLMIVLWGLAYVSAAHNHQHLKWLALVFAVEKLIYGLNWTKWMLENSVSEVYEQDAMAGVFYTIYGVNDWLFCIFFLAVFIRSVRSN